MKYLVLFLMSFSLLAQETFSDTEKTRQKTIQSTLEKQKTTDLKVKLKDDVITEDAGKKEKQNQLILLSGFGITDSEVISNYINNKYGPTIGLQYTRKHLYQLSKGNYLNLGFQLNSNSAYFLMPEVSLGEYQLSIPLGFGISEYVASYTMSGSTIITTANESTGFITGLQVGKDIGNDFSLKIQATTNTTLMVGVGFEF